ncbi:acyltransferase family protein [Lapidilactobacillus dextrinicus]|uniref:acyltransferase family protein n=1 Tax=Lapidilactobacillus dextrinicus TaxID=51664 RepID=UPI003F29DE7B
MQQPVKPKKIKKRYITGFDGLRAIGVIAVILYHLNPGIFKGGFLGVPIFMVISGYLITDHLLIDETKLGTFDYKNFWLRRIKRLYPTLLTMLLATSAYIVLFQRNLLYHLQQIVATNLLYVYNWWQIANGQSYFERFANNESPFTHLWTLSIEGQFYLLWPLLIILLLKLKRKRGTLLGVTLGLTAFSAILMAVLYAPNADPSRIYYGTDTRMFSILLGCALAIIWPSNRLKQKVNQQVRYFLDGMGAIGLLGMLILLLVSSAQSAFLYRGGMVLFTLFTVLLTAAVAHPGSNWNRILTNPVFKWLGSRSYGIYLYQFPVMIFFETRFTDIADHQILYPVIEVILILLISELSYRVVETNLGKLTWQDIKDMFRWLFLPRNSRALMQYRAMVGVLALIFITGSVGVLTAFGVTNDNANKSGVATTIKANKKKTAKQNEALVAKMKAAKSQSEKAKSDKSYSLSISRSNSIRDAQIGQDSSDADLRKLGLTNAELKLAKNLSITGVGDSVMLGSAEGYKRIFPNMYLDADVSRQLYQTLPIVDQIADKGALADVVLLGLGTNGDFTANDLSKMMNKLGPKRKIYWINAYVPTRSWQNEVNEKLAAAEKKYKNLKVIDWYSYAKKHPSWFANDHVHPNPKGSPHYTAFVAKAVLKDLLKDQK